MWLYANKHTENARMSQKRERKKLWEKSLLCGEWRVERRKLPMCRERRQFLLFLCLFHFFISLSFFLLRVNLTLCSDERERERESKLFKKKEFSFQTNLKLRAQKQKRNKTTQIKAEFRV
jgi:hypothetical protein